MSEAAGVVAYSVLGVAALLTLIRIVRGPSVLDRAVGSEVLVSILVCAIGIQAAMSRQPHALPILVSLSLLGFLGSGAVVRFVPRDVDPGRSPLSRPGDVDAPASPGPPGPAGPAGPNAPSRPPRLMGPVGSAESGKADS
jgi:multicomponent Na+:H+ antiporter subunit F